MNIGEQHFELLRSLLRCEPLSARAHELREMMRRLEEIDPKLERVRLDAMRVEDAREDSDNRPTG